MARPRYQNGSLVVRGRPKRYVLRWREDVRDRPKAIKIEHDDSLSSRIVAPNAAILALVHLLSLHMVFDGEWAQNCAQYRGASQTGQGLARQFED